MPETLPGAGAAAPARDRIARARELVSARDLDGLVVSRPENVRYLSGFTGSSGALLVGSCEPMLVTDGRYAEQAASEAPGLVVEVASGTPAVVAAGLAAGRRTGFEAGGVSYQTWERMVAATGEAGARLVPCCGLVEGMRARKDDSELALIGSAVAIASRCLEEVLEIARPGAVERDLALDLEFRMKRAGAEGAAFDLIVASGPRSALPHGRASEKTLGTGEFVVFDIGARFRGYHSDLTRTIFTGRPGDRATRIYRTVLAAQQAAIDAIAPGVAASAVDRAARDVIEAAGFGDRFGHGTGHGVGLEVHEGPRLGPRSEETLEAGMVVTVEPGIYVPGDGGVRIEDMVVVTGSGCRLLTHVAKDAWFQE